MNELYINSIPTMLNKQIKTKKPSKINPHLLRLSQNVLRNNVLLQTRLLKDMIFVESL